jgi:bile acid:Na+ symporter, BASS family
MKTLIDVTIPIGVFYLMFIVGLELTGNDFRKVLVNRKVIVVATILQFISIPIIAVVVVQLINPRPHILAGVLLVAACPGGGISNYYTYLARANTALSVTLTTVSCLAAILTLPICMEGFKLYLSEQFIYKIPFVKLLIQLLLFVVLPVIIGMKIRKLYPEIKEKYEGTLRYFGFLAFVILIGLVIYKERANIPVDFLDTAFASVAFTIITMILGFAAGWIMGLSASDRFTLLIEFAVRNLAIATAISVGIFHDLGFAVFATVYFLVQVPIVIAAIFLFRRFQSVRYAFPP